jgi:cytochrome c5
MKKIFSLLFAGLFILSFSVFAQNKYVGSKMCGMCHKGEKKGSQLEIWQKSQHAKAFETLKSAEAEKIKKGASEATECLECHAITADAKFTPEGVSCEMCHGAGSAYKSIMKDKAKAVAAGLVDFKDNATIEKTCKKCHNEKSPTHKGFKFEEMWAKIKHPAPKG